MSQQPDPCAIQSIAIAQKPDDRKRGGRVRDRRADKTACTLTGARGQQALIMARLTN